LRPGAPQSGGLCCFRLAAIRNLGLIDNLADYTGSGNDNYIGGLVGLQSLFWTLLWALLWTLFWALPYAVQAQNMADADGDGDGLIEIHDLTMLHNMRHDLTGASYKSGTVAVGRDAGCPLTGCIGYELIGDLDFDADGDGRSWSGDSESGYLLDAGDSRQPYFDVDIGGWQPIGDPSNPFAAVFEGNGHRIRNLAVSTATAVNIGLFGVTADGAIIRNLGLVDNLADYSGGGVGYIGGLVGRQRGGSIVASYATGPADGGRGEGYVGGLVGRQSGGSITASHARGPAAGGGMADAVGALVGQQFGGSITASYATGAADGGDDGGRGEGYVGGLVGPATMMLSACWWAFRTAA
jgi:hypothetical protein